MTSFISLHLKLTLAVLVVAGICIGCENSVDPFSDRGAYSVYGALSLAQGQNEQFIRVKPLDEPLASMPNQPLPATVSIENLSTGRITTLEDSIIVYGDDNVTHNFTANLDVKPKTKYQLSVQGPDGALTEATTVTPTNTVATIDPAGSTPGPPTDTVHVDSDTLHCQTRFTVRHREAKVPANVSVGMKYNGSNLWLSQDARIRELDNNSGQGFRFSVNGLLNQTIDGSVDDRETCRYAENYCQNLDAGRIQIAYTYLAPEWYGEEPTDDGVAGFDPTNSREIGGGLGFFGSYFQDTVSVTINRGLIDLGPDACGPSL